MFFFSASSAKTAQVVLSAWLCGWQNDLKFNMLAYLLGLKGPAQCISFGPNPMKVHVVPRDGGTHKVSTLPISVQETECEPAGNLPNLRG